MPESTISYKVIVNVMKGIAKNYYTVSLQADNTGIVAVYMKFEARENLVNYYLLSNDQGDWYPDH